MQDVMVWSWWYGMLLVAPLILVGLFVKDRVTKPIPQRMARHRSQQ